MNRLGKRWYGIPAVVLVAVLVLALAAGSVFAAYSFWQVTGAVTVNEPMTVVLAASNANVVWDGAPGLSDFSVPIDPGRQIKIGWDVTNNSVVPLTVMPSTTPATADGGNIATIWRSGPGPGPPIAPPGLVIPGGATQRFALTITASGSTTPGTYTFNPIAFDRS